MWIKVWLVGEFVWGDGVDVVLDRLGVVMFDVGFDAVRCVGGGVWLVEKVGSVLEDGGFLVSGWCGDAGESVIWVGGEVGL